MTKINFSEFLITTSENRIEHFKSFFFDPTGSLKTWYLNIGKEIVLTTNKNESLTIVIDYPAFIRKRQHQEGTKLIDFNLKGIAIDLFESSESFKGGMNICYRSQYQYHFDDKQHHFTAKEKNKKILRVEKPNLRSPFSDDEEFADVNLSPEALETLIKTQYGKRPDNSGVYFDTENHTMVLPYFSEGSLERLISDTLNKPKENSFYTSFKALIDSIIEEVKCFVSMQYAHCDIKPDNFLIKRDEKGQYQVSLVDLETVKKWGKGNILIAGSYFYLPPNPQDNYTLEKIDLYALCVTLLVCYHPYEFIQIHKKFLKEQQVLIEKIRGAKTQNDFLELNKQLHNTLLTEKNNKLLSTIDRSLLLSPESKDLFTKVLTDYRCYENADYYKLVEEAISKNQVPGQESTLSFINEWLNRLAEEMSIGDFRASFPAPNSLIDILIAGGLSIKQAKPLAKTILCSKPLIDLGDKASLPLQMALNLQLEHLSQHLKNQTFNISYLKELSENALKVSYSILVEDMTQAIDKLDNLSDIQPSIENLLGQTLHLLCQKNPELAKNKTLIFELFFDKTIPIAEPNEIKKCLELYKREKIELLSYIINLLLDENRINLDNLKEKINSLKSPLRQHLSIPIDPNTKKLLETKIDEILKITTLAELNSTVDQFIKRITPLLKNCSFEREIIGFIWSCLPMLCNKNTLALLKGKLELIKSYIFSSSENNQFLTSEFQKITNDVNELFRKQALARRGSFSPRSTPQPQSPNLGSPLAIRPTPQPLIVSENPHRFNCPPPNKAEVKPEHKNLHLGQA